MASIKAIERSSVHQIQSGQVIVDLNSVVKELVENSLDAGATSIEVRFRNHGLDAIEVVDNGNGITQDDYASVGLKHHTSKLSNYDDLTTLETFGFRGEALASLCALSKLHIITARADEAPKGNRLDFEVSGQLKSAQVTATQRGTKVVVENLFHNLPVRKKELEKNVKREYGKVLTLLQAYACISTGVRFVVSNQMPKGSKTTAFSTAINASTKDNITNVFGAKSSQALIKLDLKLEMQPIMPGLATQSSRTLEDSSSREVLVQGHISRPVFGEGRQAPDRQMFFVNSRPCGLPQVSKAFNEVYKSFNVSQSPFVFANLVMDTAAYDVNVSPDKRTILLHDQNALLESLKIALAGLFELQEQSVPQSNPGFAQNKLPSYKPLSVNRMQMSKNSACDIEPITPSHLAVDGRVPSKTPTTTVSPPSQESESEAASDDDQSAKKAFRFATQRVDPEKLVHNWVGRNAQDREDVVVRQPKLHQTPAAPVPNAFDRMRPLRTPKQIADITIGDRTTSTTIGSTTPAYKKRRIHNVTTPQAQSLRAFAMSGTQLASEGSQEEDEQGSEDGCSENGAAADHGQDESASQSSGGNGKDYNVDFAPKATQAASSDDLFDSPSPPTAAPDNDDDDETFSDEHAREGSDGRVGLQEDEATMTPSLRNIRRASQALRGTLEANRTTLNMAKQLDLSIDQIRRAKEDVVSITGTTGDKESQEKIVDDIDKPDAESQLSLTVAKADFAGMHIVGQFNLGFILALRSGQDGRPDDLFIIDQHAADEKFNFERFTRILKLEPQRLAQPKQLSLTAIEEEIILEHAEALLANGFEIEVSDGEAVGQRCRLLSLPMSKETIFGLPDLEELLHLLSEYSSTSSEHNIPRPSRVRKMLAMRACRSSIMVGKTLTRAKMERVVRNLGEMDKPWNCPHGRPTMRHLAGLDAWQIWDDLPAWESCTNGSLTGGPTKWKEWLGRQNEA